MWMCKDACKNCGAKPFFNLFFVIIKSLTDTPSVQSSRFKSARC